MHFYTEVYVDHPAPRCINPGKRYSICGLCSYLKEENIPVEECKWTSNSCTDPIVCGGCLRKRLPAGHSYNQNNRCTRCRYELAYVDTPEEVEYTYRLANRNDEFVEENYKNPGNHIVITGVKTQSKNGYYIVPSTIDDKEVIGIAGKAFNTTNVNTIYISPGVRNISPYAYYGENDLEIIFREDLYIDYLAFTFHRDHSDQAQLKITCPEACTNRLGNTYVKLAPGLFRAVYTPLKEDASTPADTNQSVSYLYRLADAEDLGLSSYFDKNEIVITGVHGESPTGEYIIPSYIDGMRVRAIMPEAFIGTNVKKVIIGSTIEIIWNYAFSDCDYLTDIYFAGEYLDAQPNAFPRTNSFGNQPTIHCSATCHNAKMALYKNMASFNWEEWSGL